MSHVCLMYVTYTHNGTHLLKGNVYSMSLSPSCVTYNDNDLVKSVVNYGILARCHFVVGRNVMFLTHRYAWSLGQLVSGRIIAA